MPYCSLYDRGYTSIGLTHNTVPNPALRLVARDMDSKMKSNFGAESVEYLPAHCLAHSELERDCRVPTSATSNSTPIQSPPSAVNSTQLFDGSDNGYTVVSIIVLYNASRMSGYISRLLQLVGTLGQQIITAQLLPQRFSNHIEFNSLLTTILNARGVVVVVGDYSESGISVLLLLKRDMKLSVLLCCRLD